MITWQWICFAAIILAANGSENNENDHCGKEEKSSTPRTTTTMEATTTACPCSIPPFYLPFTNDKYTANWWSSLKAETQVSYNSSFFVDAVKMRRYIQPDGCSVYIACLVYDNVETTFIKATAFLANADDQIYNSTFYEGDDLRIFLDCNRDGQYTYKGVTVDIQVAGCMSVVSNQSP
ncbi:hypothetical protein B9Z55_016619 [Caenorhabditis nigoni]|uniref:Uncharacterized protein n=1 Tax=Caenorhabditis nigoni TaxID=1611254 RepID=A0A2G5T609_9PELO|nr:hypothetical protein B9Z55_016619 [Caenorhabditis nigoni]